MVGVVWCDEFTLVRDSQLMLRFGASMAGSWSADALDGRRQGGPPLLPLIVGHLGLDLLG